MFRLKKPKRKAAAGGQAAWDEIRLLKSYNPSPNLSNKNSKIFLIQKVPEYPCDRNVRLRR